MWILQLPTSYPYALKKHEILTHFVCLICRRVAETIKELMKHQESGSCGASSHNSYKLKKCENCDHITVGAFINTHYKHCPFRFHRKQNHNDVSYGCDKCDQKFKNLNYMRGHKRKSHKVQKKKMKVSKFIMFYQDQNLDNGSFDCANCEF